MQTHDQFRENQKPKITDNATKRPDTKNHLKYTAFSAVITVLTYSLLAISDPGNPIPRFHGDITLEKAEIISEPTTLKGDSSILEHSVKLLDHPVKPNPKRTIHSRPGACRPESVEVGKILWLQVQKRGERKAIRGVFTTDGCTLQDDELLTEIWATRYWHGASAVLVAGLLTLYFLILSLLGWLRKTP